MPRPSISDAYAMISDYSIVILVTMRFLGRVCVATRHDITRARTSPLSSSDIDCCDSAIALCNMLMTMWCLCISHSMCATIYAVSHGENFLLQRLIPSPLAPSYYPKAVHKVFQIYRRIHLLFAQLIILF